jgi:hypothetical protein
MNRAALTGLVILCLVALACGRYGPPTRTPKLYENPSKLPVVGAGPDPICEEPEEKSP